MSVFDEARRRIGSSFIESEFGHPQAYWSDGEYWTVNPLRADGSPGSFSINAEGLWYDFATQSDAEKGDCVDLISRRDNIGKKEAAQYIVRRCGGTVDDETPPPKRSNTRAKSKKKEKSAPVVPVPSDRLKSLNETIHTEWTRERYGEPVAGWRYHTAEGGVAFCVARFEKQTADGAKKAIVPWYYDGQRWRQGQAFADSRPLYRLHELTRDTETPVLVVEGELCADIAVPGYLVTTWSGGSKAVDKTDWSPLEGRNVTIWPDYDEPGAQAAQAIALRLPQARIIDVGATCAKLY